MCISISYNCKRVCVYMFIYVFVNVTWYICIRMYIYI